LLRRGGRLLTALVPAAILIGVGFAAWVIPGVIVALFFSFIAPVVVIEGIGGSRGDPAQHRAGPARTGRRP